MKCKGQISERTIGPQDMFESLQVLNVLKKINNE